MSSEVGSSLSLTHSLCLLALALEPGRGGTCRSNPIRPGWKIAPAPSNSTGANQQHQITSIIEKSFIPSLRSLDIFPHQLFGHSLTACVASQPPTNTFSIMANALNNLYRLAIPAAVGYSLFQASIYDVKGGSRAVIFDRLSGVQEQVVGEGTHFLIPWLQRSIIYDVRTKPRNISTTTGSKDLQMVSLTLRVLHRPDVQKLPKIYQVGHHRL